MKINTGKKEIVALQPNFGLPELCVYLGVLPGLQLTCVCLIFLQQVALHGRNSAGSS